MYAVRRFSPILTTSGRRFQFMGIKEYFSTLNKKMKAYDKNAKNPFLEYNYAYNPFKSAISQTYVWVEKLKKEKGGEKL